MAEYHEFTVSVQQRTPNAFRKNAYDPDFDGADGLDRGTHSPRWKGYNGYWKTRASLRVHAPTKVIAHTDKFNMSYHTSNGRLNLADVRKRGMYGY